MTFCARAQYEKSIWHLSTHAYVPIDCDDYTNIFNSFQRTIHALRIATLSQFLHIIFRDPGKTKNVYWFQILWTRQEQAIFIFVSITWLTGLGLNWKYLQQENKLQNKSSWWRNPQNWNAHRILFNI